jgi:DNA-binding transcriptional LysR family regulator
MDARQLRCFLAVVDHGGVNRAAEALFLAQPSVSQSLRSLERDLDTALFHRTGGRLVLTAAGEVLVDQARDVVRGLELSRALVEAVDGLQGGRLVIASTPSQSVSPLADLVAGFLQRHPGLSVDVRAAPTPDDVATALKTGEAELGLIGRAPSARVPPGLVIHHLRTDRFVVVTRNAADLPGAERPLHPEDLRGARLIVGQVGTAMRRVADDILAAAEGSRAVVEIQQREALLPLVLSGAGMAVVAASWQGAAEAAGLTVRELSVAESLEVALVHRSGRLSPAATAFLQMSLPGGKP